MFYLTTHSTHFIYGYMASDIWLRTILIVRKEHPLPPHRLLLSISSKGFFYMHHPTDRITHTTAFVTPVVEHWLEREIDQWVHPFDKITTLHGNTYTSDSPGVLRHQTNADTACRCLSPPTRHIYVMLEFDFQQTVIGTKKCGWRHLQRRASSSQMKFGTAFPRRVEE